MARLIKKEAKKPLELKCGNESKWICLCGLSANQPFCDGSHGKTESEEEGKTYVYKNGGRKEADCDCENGLR